MADTTNTVVKDPSVLLHSFDWQVVDPAVSGKYVIVDLTKNVTEAYTLNKSTVQGEDGIQLNFWFKDGRASHHLSTDAQITLYMLDADSKIRVGTGVLDPIRGQSGCVIVTLTAPFFQNAGQTHLLLAVNDGGATQISSPMLLNTADNMFTITTGDIEYSQAVDDAIQAMVKKVTDVTTTAKELQDTFTNIQTQLANHGYVTTTDFEAQVAKLAKLTGDNTFTGLNTFNGPVHFTDQLTWQGHNLINESQLIATPRTQDGVALINGAMGPNGSGSDGRPAYSMININGSKTLTIQVNCMLPKGYTLGTPFAQLPANLVQGFWHMPFAGVLDYGDALAALMIDQNGMLSIMGWGKDKSVGPFELSTIATMQV